MPVLTRHHSLTLDAWGLLSTLLLPYGTWNQRSILHHKARIEPPFPGGSHDPTDLPLHLGPSWSSTAFITHLTLGTTCELSTAHLLQLSSMPNLGLLRIVEPTELLPSFPGEPSPSRSRVTDRVVRAWAEQPNPFPTLRVLQLSCCPEVTPQCLRYLAAFPALVYVFVRGPREIWDWGIAHDVAPRHGWRIPILGYDVQALMRRYFGSCLGIHDGLPERLKLAARLVAGRKPAGLSRLFDGVTTVEVGERPAVLPWKGGVPLDASVSEYASAREDAKKMPLGDTATVYDDPMWWLYAAIGHVIFRDGDLGGGGEVPTLNGWVQPPLPVLSLTMAPLDGDAARDRAPRRDKCTIREEGAELTEGYELVERRHLKYVFVRGAAFDGVVSREAAWVPGKAPAESKGQDQVQSEGGGSGSGARSSARSGDVPLRQRKRRKMGDVLSSMAGG